MVLKKKISRASILKPTHTTFLGIVITLATVMVVGYILLGLSLRGLRNAQELAQYQSQPVQGSAKFIIESTSLQENQQGIVDITLDTATHTVDGADLILSYDPQKLKVEDVVLGTVFNSYRKNIMEQSGRVEIYGWFTEVIGTYKGQGDFAKLVVRPLTTGMTTITPVCQVGSTQDTNVTYQGDDLVNCSLNVEGTITMTTATSSPTPSALPTANPTAPPVPTPTPIGATPTPTVVATAQPSATPDTGTGGNQSSTSPYTDPSCKDPAPGAPTNFQATTGPGSGQVKLTWSKPYGADNYFINFGQKWLDWEFGQTNIGDTDQFMVNGLKPGELYYFVIAAKQGCATSGYSDGKSAYAGKISYASSNYSSTTGTTSYTTTATPVNYYGYDQSTGLDKGYGVDPSASQSAAVQDWGTVDQDFDSLIGSDFITMTPEATLSSVIYAPGDVTEEESFWDQLLRYLPWLGLALLFLLALLLVIFARRRRKQFHYYDEALDSSKSKSVETGDLQPWKKDVNAEDEFKL